jgi:hypothetical protein
LNFVRHVQRRSRCRSAITAVRSLTVAGGGRRPMRLQIESSDPLVAQIAEVQPAIRSDDETVRIIDFLIGESR